jgi:two-component system sensor histidine kinase DesK
VLEQDAALSNVSLLTENILSMCLKEAVNNVVRHSKAKTCYFRVEQTWDGIVMTVRDDGIGCITEGDFTKGNGLNGMKERLEFVNGSLEIHSEKGTTLIIKVPNDVKQKDKEDVI